MLNLNVECSLLNEFYHNRIYFDLTFKIYDFKLINKMKGDTIMKIFIFFALSILFFSCASHNNVNSKENALYIEPVSTKELKNISPNKFPNAYFYLPCDKDSKDFYPFYKICWDYGYQNKNCKNVENSKDLTKLSKKSVKNLKESSLSPNSILGIQMAKIMTCMYLCNEAVKQKQPSLDYEDYLNNCPVGMKTVIQEGNIYFYFDKKYLKNKE